MYDTFRYNTFSKKDTHRDRRDAHTLSHFVWRIMAYTKVAVREEAHRICYTVITLKFLQYENGTENREPHLQECSAKPFHLCPAHPADAADVLPQR